MTFTIDGKQFTVEQLEGFWAGVEYENERIIKLLEENRIICSPDANWTPYVNGWTTEIGRVCEPDQEWHEANVRCQDLITLIKGEQK